MRHAIRARRWPITAVLVILVLGGAYALWSASRSTASATPATTQVTLTPTTVSQTVSATGTIASADEADLSFAVSGTVDSVKVAVGDKVRKGEALATVDDDQLASAVTLAKANLTSATAAYTAAVDDDASAAQLASAKAQVAAAKTSLATARTSLADATLRSTLTGTVASIAVSAGDAAGGSSGSSSGGSGSGSGSGAAAGSSNAASTSTSSSAQIVVISTSSWIVNASVGSTDLASLRKGMQAQITPTDATTAVFGTVRSVGIVASTSSSSGAATFPVVIEVTGHPKGLYAGGSANVVITVKQVPNVLSVPSAAIHSSGGRTYVYQVTGGKQVATTVTLGTTYGRTTQITKGLSSGAVVVVPATTTGRVGTRTGGTGGYGGGGFGGGTGGFGGGTGGFGGGGTGGAGGAAPAGTGGGAG